MTPRNLKSAIENDYLISNILYKGSKKCRVDVKPRFYDGGKAIISFWISSSYVERTYPNSYERF